MRASHIPLEVSSISDREMTSIDIRDSLAMSQVNCHSRDKNGEILLFRKHNLSLDDIFI